MRILVLSNYANGLYLFRKELIEQFFSGKEMPANGIDMSLREDVGLWPELAQAWIKRI